MQTVLEVKNLSKTFGKFIAVNDISFSIREGEIVGLLGPNGAGKTTTTQMLLGLIIPDSGTIAYFGRNFMGERREVLGQINFASAYSKVQAKLTVRQNLTVYANLYGLVKIGERISEVLDFLEAEDLADTLFWKLSSGQKTRVILAKALLNHPRLILMDEPTASLDPDIAAKVLNLIRQLQEKEQVALLYTSHNMDEVEKICDRVIFLNHGSIVAEDTPFGLTKRVKVGRLTITYDGPKEPIAAYLEEKQFKYNLPRPQVVVVELPDEEMAGVLFGLSKRNVWITEINVEKPDLEDVFLSIVKGDYAYSKN